MHHRLTWRYCPGCSQRALGRRVRHWSVYAAGAASAQRSAARAGQRRRHPPDPRHASPPDAHPAERAGWLAGCPRPAHAVPAGRPANALPVTQKAITTYRQLAAASSGLALSLAKPWRLVLGTGLPDRGTAPDSRGDRYQRPWMRPDRPQPAAHPAPPYAAFAHVGAIVRATVTESDRGSICFTAPSRYQNRALKIRMHIQLTSC
jgi:hypothetical protein